MKCHLGGRPAWLSLCTNCGKQKRYLQIFREVSSVFQQNFNGSKNSAVLEPRTGQFSRTYGFEAKAKVKDLRLRDQGQGQGLQNVSSRTYSRQGRPRGFILGRSQWRNQGEGLRGQQPPLAKSFRKYNHKKNKRLNVFWTWPKVHGGSRG